MFIFHPVHFRKVLVKSQPQRSYKKGSYIYLNCKSSVSPRGGGGVLPYKSDGGSRRIFLK